ncbi:hypothetical protein [Clostridium tertium]|uniref:hypothetical protein n=1 Tax=Clostridium tertium TaxID=1559 RepID=UPI0015D46F31|nr:hypothetical protein [Clostridium tertium]
MGNQNEAIKLVAEIEIVQARIKKRLAKGKGNYTEEDNLNSAIDDILYKQLIEKLNKLI